VRLVAGGRLVTPDAVLDPGWVETDGSRIRRVGEGAPPGAPDVDLDGHVVVPGFVDLHVHGGHGASYSSGRAEEAALAAAFHRRHGTTTTLASLVTAAPDALVRQVRALTGLVAEDTLAGVHLEGPYLSRERRGAHDPALLRTPDRAELARLLEAGDGAVRMVTLAPELDGGLDAVRQVADAGAVAAVGHTSASFDVTRAAVEAGARVATHLFNGMTPLHHREPGAVGALLTDPRATLELVCDGAHVHPSVVATAVRAAGAGRVALVTDAMAAAGLGDGSFVLGGLAVEVTGGVARLAGQGSLAGSTLTTAAAFRWAVTQAGVALADAARMAATTPAAALGLADVGRIAPGLRADLVVLDRDLQVARVLARGEWVDREA